MLKFFRKYNTIILVFGGIFLMIAFLLPQAIQQFSPARGNRSLFKVGDKTYGTQEVNTAQRQESVLSGTFDVGTRIRNAHRLAFGIESTEHYIMLVQLAKKMGLYNPGGVADEMRGRLFTAVHMRLYGQPPQQKQLDELGRLYSEAVGNVRDPELAEEAFRNLDAIVRLREMYGLSNSLSEPELALYSSRLFDAVEANIGVITGEAYAQTLPALTEEEIVAHYETYRDDQPEDNEYGFSYRLDSAAKFELLMIDRQLIEDALGFATIDLKTYHRLNKDSNGYADDFSISRTQVERDIRSEKADEIIKSITDRIDNTLVSKQSPLERGENNLRVLPQDWESQRPSFESLRDSANEVASRLIATAEPVARILRFDDRWYTGEQIRTEDELANLGLTVQGRRAPLSNAIMLFPEFEPVNAVPGAQSGITISGIGGGFGRNADVGYLRVLDTRKEGPSTSIEEVREEVERNARSLRGYLALMERKDEILRGAIDSKEFASYVYTVLDVDEGVTVAQNAIVKYYDIPTRRQTPTPVATTGNAEASSLLGYVTFARKLIEKTQEWSPTTPFEEVPIEDRCFVMGVPESQSLALPYVTRREPVTLETLRLVSVAAAQYLTQQVVENNPDNTLRSSLSQQAIAERLGFKPLSTEYTDEGIRSDKGS